MIEYLNFLILVFFFKLIPDINIESKFEGKCKNFDKTENLAFE